MIQFAFLILILLPQVVLGISLPPVPPSPLAPPPNGSNLPIVIQNGSELSENDIYIAVTGDQVGGANHVVVNFGNGNTGGLLTIDEAVWKNGANANQYSKSLSAFSPAVGSQIYNGQSINNFCFYLPLIQGGVIWFSIGQSLNMPVVDGNGLTYAESLQKQNYATIPPYSIRQPSFSDPGDPNFNIIFDIFEVAYVNTAPNIVVDATAVTFFSLPLYGYISTPNAGSGSNTGIYYPQNYAFSQLKSFFSSSKENSTWNNLILTNDEITLRALSPGKGMVTLPDGTIRFNQNYLDSANSYGYSYIEDIWTGATSFIRRNLGNIQLKIPIDGGITYTLSNINSSNQITFTPNQPHLNPVIFNSPTTNFPTTSFDIFAATPLCEDPNDGNAIQVSKLFEEAIICSVFPTTDLINGNDFPYLQIYKDRYYTVNPNLSSAGQIRGPWYCLYSQALHSLGSIYTYGFDEPIWPDVQIASDTLESNTYVGITIASLTTQPTSQVTVSTLANPIQSHTPITITATVSDTHSGTPSGSVAFSIDGEDPIFSIISNGVATLNTSFSERGIHYVTAHYLGDSTTLESTSPPFPLFVTATSPSSSTTLNSQSIFDTSGQTLNLVAIVQSTTSSFLKNKGPFSPQGSVIFTINGQDSDPITLRFGKAEKKIILPLGVHQIDATYSGDANYVSSVDSINISVSAVHPPSNAKIHQNKHCMNAPKHVTNILTWAKPKSGTKPILYRIYRDKDLKKLIKIISGVGSKHFIYRDYCKKCDKIYRYFIVSEDKYGNVSEPVELKTWYLL